MRIATTTNRTCDAMKQGALEPEIMEVNEV